jgi:hypothetical protein
MKRVIIVALGALMVAAMSFPAAAFEIEFGGYWYTRAFSQKNFTGDDSGAKDWTGVKNRNRLNSMVIFSDDLKWINEFEYDVTWGDTNGGDIGTDGTGIFGIKLAYADFDIGSFNFRIGLQPADWGYVNTNDAEDQGGSFVFNADFAGATVTYKGKRFSPMFTWAKAYEGGMGDDANDQDVDYYYLRTPFTIGNNLTITPLLLNVTSEDASSYTFLSGYKKVSLYYIGAEININFKNGSLWFTGVYETGDVDPVKGGSRDVGAPLFAMIGKYFIDPVELRGQLIYISGDSNPNDNDIKAYMVPRGAGYWWSEIMGRGSFHNQQSAGTPQINSLTNLIAANAGVGFPITDKLRFDADLWSAYLDKEDADGDDYLGTEIDLMLTYKLTKNLEWMVKGAYLFAGDATSPVGKHNTEDPIEFGTRLFFKF